MARSKPNSKKAKREPARQEQNSSGRLLGPPVSTGGLCVFGPTPLCFGMARTFTGPEASLLLRQARTASLATIDRNGGTPYASLVNLATTLEGQLFVFISKLAWHTQNLMSDGRGSLLATALPATGDALTGPRVTVMGRFIETKSPTLRARYAAQHPQARTYLDFPDFSFWRLSAETIHAIAGFGRIETLAPGEVFSGPATQDLYDSALSHVNEDHAEAVQLYARKLLGAAGHGQWKIACVDPDGCHVSDGETALRLSFDTPAHDAQSLRAAFAELSRRARVV